MVTTQITMRMFTKKVKKLDIAAMMTIMLNMNMGKSRAQRMACPLLQDVSAKVSVLYFVEVSS